MLRLFLSIPIVLAGCLKDETVSGYADPNATYQLIELNGAAFNARATISFPEQGSVTGKGPCNSYGASQSAPYPWVEIGAIRATRAACAELALENEFFAALSGMTQIEAFGDTVFLRDDAGREMIFRTTQP